MNSTTNLNELQSVVGRSSEGAIIVRYSAFEDRQGIDIRKYFQPADTDELKPTRKGIWIPLSQCHDILEAFRNIVEKSGSVPRRS